MKKRKIAWRRVALAVAVLAGVTAGMYQLATADTEVVYIDYRKEVAPGDTIWDVCQRVAREDEDLRKIVYDTMVLNDIHDPGELMPGQEIVVRVRMRQ